jgi:hypothetical protein
MPSPLSNIVSEILECSGFYGQERVDLKKELESHFWYQKRDLQLQGYSEEKIETTIRDHFGNAGKIGHEFFMVKPWYMKYKLVGIAILITSFLLASFFFLLWMSDRNYFENVRRNQNNFSRVETIQLTEHSTSSTVSISIEYPKVISIADTDTEREINHKLHEKVQMIVENFKKELLSSSIRSSLKTQPRLEITFTPLTVTNQVVSIVFSATKIMSSTTNNTFFVFNYLISRRTEIELHDIFNSDDYVPVLQQKISETIHAQALNGQKYHTDQYFIDLDTQHIVPSREQLKNFGLRYNAIIFYLNSDALHPWGGEVTLDLSRDVNTILKSEIKKYLKTE